MHPIARTVRSRQPARTMAPARARLKSALESQSARCLPARCLPARCGSMRLQPSLRPGSGRYWLLQEKEDRAEPVPRGILAKLADAFVAQPDRYAGAASATQPTARRSSRNT
jgi:hypothetical protein